MADVDFSFSSVQTFDGSSTYVDITNEMRSPAGTSQAVLAAAAHYLYMGHDEKFDLAVFDLDTVGSIGALTWQYWNGSAWTTFVPGSGRFQYDVNDSAGVAWAFNKDGAELFPPNLLTGWATTAINSITKYWIRLTTASVTTAPTVKRIQMRPLAAYCSTQDVYELLQLSAVLGGTDFTTTTTPTKATVESFIQEAQAYIDYTTRKSWRPAIIYNEYHEFQINGIKLDRANPYKILSLDIWNGAEFDSKNQGRTSDFFLIPDTGMIYFSRYFLLPARMNTNAPAWRWGGGEFTSPIKVTYLNGKDLYGDEREGGIAHDSAKKLAAMSILRSSDYGNTIVSGMDRLQVAQKMQGWKEEVDDRLDSLKAFETF